MICKLFNNSTKTDEQLVVKILSVNIQRLLTNYVDSLEDLNLQISELNECLQFKLALEAICLNDKEVLALAKRAIVKYHDEFKYLSYITATIKPFFYIILGHRYHQL